MKNTPWMYVKKESIVLTLLVLTILYSASVFVLNPTVEAQPTEPTLIGRTDVFGHSYQRYTFYANGRFWVFYSDNTNLVYVTSVDGSTWSSATAMRAASSNPEFSVWFDGTNVHYAKGQKDQVPNTPLYYRMGVPNANGNITWNALEQIVAPAVANRSYRAPQIITDSDGYPVITYLNKTTFPSANAVSVSKSSTKNGTWTNAAGFPAVVSTDAAWPFSVPLKSSKLYTMWSIDDGKIRGSLYNGAFWGSAADCSSNYIGEDSRGLSAVSYGDDVHLAYIGNETATKIYRHVKRTYGSGWGPETIVKNATGASENRGSISLTVDSNNGNLWMWFNTTDNKIASRKYTALTSNWETDDAHPFGDLFTFPYYITTSYQVRNNKILAYWQEGTTMPYDLVFSYFAVDTVPPVVSILSPIDKTYAVADVPLTFTVSESTSWIGYSLDGQANVTITGNTVLTGLSEGLHSVVVYANDTAGNMGKSSLVSFAVDTIQPNISILSPIDKTYAVADVPLTFTVSESTSWIGYSLDGQANVTITGNTVLTGLSEGLHSVVVYANDTAGNMGKSSLVSFAVDTIQPTISILSPIDKTYTAASVPLTFTVSESTSWIGYSLDGQANVTITGNTVLTGLSEGLHSVVVYANDTAGNMGKSSLVSFAVDTIQPNISILSPIDKTYAVADVPLTFTVSESTSWIGYSLDGQANVTITGNTVLADLSDGSHSLTVYASDTAGNMVASGTFSFSIDTTAPTITITSPENKSYVTPNVPLTFTIDESVSWVAYSLDGQANATISGNITLTALSDGSHSLIVYARDIAGHTGVSETILFTVSIPQEPFPNWAIATIAAIVIVVAALLIYFTKVRKTTEKAPATDEESN